MRRVWYLTVPVLLLTFGCGKSPNPDTAVAPAPQGVSEEGNGADAIGETLVETEQTPQYIVSSFLKATRDGDQAFAESLLTAQAIAETRKHGLSLSSMGSPTMEYAVGRSEAAPNNGVYVNSVWSKQYDDGTADQHEIVWLLREEQAGWRISGMVTQLDPEADPLFIDFENPGELAERLSGEPAEGSDAPVAGSDEPPVRQAQNPANALR